MNYTTIEQSKKLLELGIDPKTADAWWYRTTYGEVVDWKHIKWNEEGTTEHLSLFRIEPSSEVAIVKREEIPAWSLNALMELLPPSINHYDEADRCNKNYGLNLFRSYYHCCGYSFGPSLSQENHDSLYCCGGDTWIEAVYKTIIWGVQQGYLKV